jgi:hypothetical protein
MTNLDRIKQAVQITTDQEGKPIVQIPLGLWEEILTQIEPQQTEVDIESAFSVENPPPGSLALLAKLAREADIVTGETDVSKRSREILDTEYVDYLAQRMKRPKADAAE